jgi:nicotinamidase/pyrazinamidase
MAPGEKRALIVTDVQNDFCPGGALAVSQGDAVVPIINRMIPLFPTVVATQDWHPAEHISFASRHKGKKPLDVITLDGQEQVLWPDHCVQGSRGADFHPDLDTRGVRLILRKGTRRELDSYSGFYENDRATETGLSHYLRGLGLTELYLCGLATDYCVYYSATDAVRLGFSTSLISDACRGVDFPEGNVADVLGRMEALGIRLLSSKDLAP